MGEIKPAFEDFLKDVHPAYLEFTVNLNETLMSRGCKQKIEAKSSGYLVSYTESASGRVILNFVFRKKGLVCRVYGDGHAKYPDFFDALPPAAVKSLTKAPNCKRLIDPAACNPKCSMGYAYTMGGELQQKCRYNAFMLDVNDENLPLINGFVERELAVRAAV